MRPAVPALFALALLCTAPAAAETLRIATEGAFAPWNTTTPAGQLTGFEVDLAQDLCRRLDAECQLVAQDWDGILPGLDQGRYDAVIAAVTITPERAQRVDFTRAYAADPAIFAVRADSPLLASLPAAGRVDLSAEPSLAQPAIGAVTAALAGRTVGVQTSTTHAQLLERVFPGVRLKAYDTIEHAALDLTSGRVDALFTARTTVATITGRGRIAAAGPSFVHGPLGHGAGMAVRRGNEALRARLDHAIAQAIADGTTARLSASWFGFDVTP